MKIIFVVSCLFISFAVHCHILQDSILIDLQRKAAREKSSLAYLYVSRYLIDHKESDKLILAYLDSSYYTAKKSNNEYFMGSYYLMAADYFESKNNFRSFITHAKKAQAYFQKVNFESFTPDLYLRLGEAYMNETNPDSARYYLKKAVHTIDRNPKHHLYSANWQGTKASSLNNIAVIYQIRNNKDSSLYYAILAEDVSKTIKDSVNLIKAQYNIAIAYNSMGRLHNAYDAYKKAAETAAARNNHIIAFYSYSGAASFAEPQKKVELALLALKHAEITKDREFIGIAWQNLGIAHFKSENNIQKTLNAHLKSLTYFDKTKHTHHIKNVNNIMMGLYLLNNQRDSAWALMQKKEEDIFETFVLNPTPFLDSTALKQEEQDIARLLSNTDISINEFRLNILQKQYLEQENKSLKQRIILITALSILTIIALLLLYNRQRQKRKTEQAARYAKEKEKEFDTLQKETEIRLTRKYIDGLESERERIAKELHDGICNDLLALEMKLKFISENEKELEEPLEILSETRTTVRNISHNLLPPVFEYESIHEMLLDYTTHIDKPANMQIYYKADNNISWATIPQNIAYQTYRIIQELLSNSIKHSKATHIDIFLTLKDNILNIEISDNGIGFDKNKKHKGIGLYTLTERIKSINGIIDIASNNGVKVSISINLNRDGNRR